MSSLTELIHERCPLGVAYTRIADISTVLRGKRLTKNELTIAGAFPVFHGGLEPLGFYSQKNREADTTMVINVGASAGTVGFCERDFWSSDGCFCISHSEHALSKYVYYVLVNQQSFLMSKVRKAGIPTLDAKVVENLQIPLPPLAVQQEIVRILDSFTELTTELNKKLTAELTARRKQYEHYRDELLTFGDDVPSLPISQIATFKYGYTDKAQDAGDARFIRITDITDDGCLNPLDAKYINMTEESKKYLLTKGDLLLARTGASYGKTLYYPDNSQAVYASFLIKIKPDNTKILNRFYWHFSKSSLYWTQAEKLVSKGGQQQFNTGAIGRVLIPVPSLDEQRRIVSILDRFDAICNDLASGLPAEIAARQKQYEYYRDKLLTFKELDT